jgi:hypothetical protein
MYKPYYHDAAITQHAPDTEMSGTGIIARTSYSCDELNGRKQKAAEARSHTINLVLQP